QVVGWRLRSPHLGQHGFRRDATVHYPSAPGFALLDLHPPEEVAQRRLVRGIARHHFVSQRETLWGHDQGNAHLDAVESVVPRVAEPPLAGFWRLACELRA